MPLLIFLDVTVNNSDMSLSVILNNKIKLKFNDFTHVILMYSEK